MAQHVMADVHARDDTISFDMFLWLFASKDSTARSKENRVANMLVLIGCEAYDDPADEGPKAQSPSTFCSEVDQ